MLSEAVVTSLIRPVRIDSVGGGWGARSSPNTPLPIFGSIVCNAATTYARKRVGSLSPSSSDSQATGRSETAAHSLTSVVFPKPAGAAMRVSSRRVPSFNRSIRWGRRIVFGRSGGTYSLVDRIVVDTSSRLRLHRRLYRWLRIAARFDVLWWLLPPDAHRMRRSARIRATNVAGFRVEGNRSREAMPASSTHTQLTAAFFKAAQQPAVYTGWLLNGTAGGLAAGTLLVLPPVATMVVYRLTAQKATALAAIAPEVNALAMAA